MSDVLAQLRDIHLPAPRWHLSATLIILALVAVSIFLTYIAWCYHRFYQIRKTALAEINVLTQKQDDKKIILAELSMLLRRTALVLFPREQVANLTEEAWLIFLDKTGNTTAFTKGMGRHLITVPYQADPVIEMKVLISIVQQWLKQVLSIRAFFKSKRSVNNVDIAH